MQLSLRHDHIPKCEDAGVLTYSRKRDSLASTALAPELTARLKRTCEEHLASADEEWEWEWEWSVVEWSEWSGVGTPDLQEYVQVDRPCQRPRTGPNYAGIVVASPASSTMWKPLFTLENQM